MKTPKIDNLGLNIILVFVCIVAVLVFNYFYLVIDHTNYNRSYIGCKFIYYGNIITIDGYTGYDNVFSTKERIYIHENVLYKLKPVKN